MQNSKQSFYQQVASPGQCGQSSDNKPEKALTTRSNMAPGWLSSSSILLMLNTSPADASEMVKEKAIVLIMSSMWSLINHTIMNKEELDFRQFF